MAPTSIFAQDVNEAQADRIIYEPVFFVAYNPQTALDMVAQVPGYDLRGESQNRGFSQGQGSLLINGKRPSTKKNSTKSILSQISASNVLRIELLRKGSSELAGQSGLIVNVITKNQDVISGSWVGTANGNYDGNMFPTGRFSINGKSNKLTYSAGVELTNYSKYTKGDERVYDAGLNLNEIRDENTYFKAPNWAFTTGLGYTGDNGSQLNLNFKGERWVSNMGETSKRFLPTSDGGFGTPLTVTDFHELETEWSYEVGGDYSFSLGSGVMKFVGLTRMEDSKYSNEYMELPQEIGSDYFFNSTRNPVEKESIARALYTFEPQAGDTIEWAIEWVKNSQDTMATFEENVGGGFQNIIVDGSTSLVEEKRAETSLLYSHNFGDSFSMNSSFAVEYSQLKVNGIDNTARSYWRPKGFVSFNYKMDEQNTLRARFEKKVGQLNFNIFASIMNVTEGTTNSQNTAIVPDQSYSAEATFEHRWGKDNVVTLDLEYNYIQDFITNIPLPSGGEGPGNYDHATTYSAKVNATISTESWLSGGKITFLSMMREARIKDPVTGEIRKIDGFQCCGALVKLRRDVPNSDWAWELQLNHGTGNYSHRLAQKVTLRNSWPDYYRAMVQHKNIFGMTLELEVRKPFGVTQHYIREFFDGDRNGAFLGKEERYRFSAAQAFLKLSSTF